jgi:hypothetical protein
MNKLEDLKKKAISNQDAAETEAEGAARNAAVKFFKFDFIFRSPLIKS